MTLVERLRLGGPNAAEVADEAADEIERLRTLLEKAGKKVALYRQQHPAEYVGGVEYNALMREIHAALPKFIED